MNIFLSSMQQMLLMFLFILWGYVLKKTRLLPENASAVMSRLENLVFMPCLVLHTFLRQCTVENLSSRLPFLWYSCLSLSIALLLALVFTPFFSGKRSEAGIYRYSLVFANIAFMGNAVVEGVFGQEVLFDYLIFTLPLNLFLNSIGISWLMPAADHADARMGTTLSSANVASPAVSASHADHTPAPGMTFRRKFLGPINLASIAGVILGLSSLPLPQSIRSVISAGSACMAPTAMLLTGFIIGGYPLRALLTAKKIYLIALYRLLILPALTAGAATLLALTPEIRQVLLCAYSMPLGLNTVIIPAAYDADTSIGASMALISNVMALVTIPLVFSLLL